MQSNFAITTAGMNLAATGGFYKSSTWQVGEIVFIVISIIRWADNSDCFGKPRNFRFNERVLESMENYFVCSSNWQ